MFRRVLLTACLLAALGAGSAPWAQETIHALPGARQQQEIEVLHAPASQQVTAVDGVAQQEIRKNEIPSPAQRRASAVGKVAVGVLAAAVAIAASAASLLLL
ncbi:MAG TPA: hypothetical protein VNO26_09875 [Candidatus Limnocylindria bacterium]|nr:hypothetical protein [Candidatus Limnocylindria bacterium]